MGQGKQQLNLKKKDSEVIDSEVIIATRTTDGRTTDDGKFRYHVLFWHSQAELKMCNLCNQIYNIYLMRLDHGGVGF